VGASVDRARARRFLRWLLSVAACWLLLGCSSGDGGAQTKAGGPRLFGERCQKTEDCASLFCVRVDEAGGVCSTNCESAAACPASDNWGCDGLLFDRAGELEPTQRHRSGDGGQHARAR
jgi:hypothetical protein